METTPWIVLMIIFTGDQEQMYAKGFVSEDYCRQWTTLYARGIQGTGQAYLSRCMTWAEFRQLQPTLALAGDS